MRSPRYEDDDLQCVECGEPDEVLDDEGLCEDCAEEAWLDARAMDDLKAWFRGAVL